VSFVVKNVPMMEEIETIWLSGTSVFTSGAYLSFLRMLADKNPIFLPLSVEAYHVQKRSYSLIAIFPHMTASSSGLYPNLCSSKISKAY